MWTQETPFPVGTRVMPSSGGAFVFRVCNVTPNSVGPWTTGPTEPAWPTSQWGDRVIDGGLVLQLYDWATQQAEFKPYGLVAA